MPKEPGYVKAVKAYLAALERHGVTAKKAYLFGSRVKGDARPDSDIDLIVVSPARSEDGTEAWASQLPVPY